MTRRRGKPRRRWNWIRTVISLSFAGWAENRSDFRRASYRASPRHAAEESPARAAAAVLSTVEDCTWPRARPMLESQHLPRCNAWPTGRIQSLALESCDKSVLLDVDCELQLQIAVQSTCRRAKSC